MYRAVANLKTGKADIKRGQAFARRALPETVARQLLAGGRIVEVSAPPVAELPQLKEYAELLSEIDITMADQFADTDPGYLAGVLHMDLRRVAELQERITRSLDAPAQSG